VADAPSKPKVGAAKWVSVTARLALLPVVLLLPAGTWRWWEAWALVGLYLAYAATISIYLIRNDPALLNERLEASPIQAEQPAWDKVLSVLMLVVGFGILLVPGFDVMRFHWSERLPVWVEITAMVIHLPCFFVIGRVMRANTFLSPVVKIDKARGHEVVTTGPYAIVRHPMYAAVIVMVVAMPLALGSRYGLIPTAAMVVVILVRTVLEDRKLHAELPGYVEYALATRYRLVRGLW
jgi:protein-S-isoprenylcysteine O-methyltransferase Ste14